MTHWVTLGIAIPSSSEAAHTSHLFSKISQENTGGSAVF